MDLNFDSVFKNFILVLRISSIHRDIKRDIKWWVMFCLKNSLITTIFLILIYNIIYVNLKERDFSMTCKNGSLSVVFLETVLQLFIYFWKEPHILWLMDKMKEDYELSKQLPAKERDIVKEYARKGQNVCKMWLLIPCTIFGCFPVMNVTLMTYYWIIEEFHLIPLYDFVYPDFIEKHKDNMIIYILTYMVTLLYGGNSTVMMIIFAPLGPVYMLHASGQLELLKVRIKGLFEDYSAEKIKKDLKAAVKQMQYIYNFVDQINMTFTVAYEITFKATTILLPVTCYEVIESTKRRELSMEFLTLIVGGITLNSTLCYYSDLLLEKGEELREAVFMCGWEKVYDREIRSILKIILLRAQRPIAIRCLFRDVCLSLLADLTNQAYALFNLMNASWG